MTAILSCHGLCKTYGGAGLLSRWRKRAPNAVDGVDLAVCEGETLAIVGESGSGKSSVAQMLLGLSPPSAGEVRFRGTVLPALTPAEHRRFRRDVQPIFQDPASSLNPRMRVGTTLGHVMRRHDVGSAGLWRGKAAYLLESVGLTPGLDVLDRYPHQLSGGQQQRVAIARALSISPRLLIADEPLSSLDMSVQAQVLDLLIGLKRRLSLALLLISHDLNVVESIADRVVVMYQGRVVESGAVRDVMTRPREAYTRALLDARLVADPRLAHRLGRTPRPALASTDFATTGE